MRTRAASYTAMARFSTGGTIASSYCEAVLPRPIFSLWMFSRACHSTPHFVNAVAWCHAVYAAPSGLSSLNFCLKAFRRSLRGMFSSSNCDAVLSQPLLTLWNSSSACCSKSHPIKISVLALDLTKPDLPEGISRMGVSAFHRHSKEPTLRRLSACEA